jgi:hypothetical protein
MILQNACVFYDDDVLYFIFLNDSIISDIYKMFGFATKSPLWSTTALVIATVAVLVSAVAPAPANSINEVQLGSSVPRVYYRNPENIPSPEDNVSFSDAFSSSSIVTVHSPFPVHFKVLVALKGFIPLLIPRLAEERLNLLA